MRPFKGPSASSPFADRRQHQLQTRTAHFAAMALSPSSAGSDSRASSRQASHSLRSEALTVDLDKADDAPEYGRRPSAQQHHLPGHAASARSLDYEMPGTPDSQDVASLTTSGDTASISTNTLPALQTRGPPDVNDRLEPLGEDHGDDPTSFELVEPADAPQAMHYSLEDRSNDIFSQKHLEYIFAQPKLLLRFTQFLGSHRKEAVPNLLFYLDAVKALKAIQYANAVAQSLSVIDGLGWTAEKPPVTRNNALEEKARWAFNHLVQEDLPAYVTNTWVQTVTTSISRRITGTLPTHLREASEGLAEVFCLTDPSREDNPIVFASEEFHRTTQYGMTHIIGRNCRFLQGPKTNPHSVRRFREACLAGKETVEVFLNYRRDGSPFMNLLMIAPLRDSKGILRYFIGAQIDVSGLAKECTDLEGLQTMLADRAEGTEHEEKDSFHQLSEMLNTEELEMVRKTGGQMHRQPADEEDDSTAAAWQKPRLLLKDPSPGGQGQEQEEPTLDLAGRNLHGKLGGIYSHYLLVRPYPSLRILFTSPSLRLPGILQSPFMDRVGSSERVREELVSALAEGRGVTAKIRWVTRSDPEGRPRWIHCTPLLGHNGQVGVWMIVIVDDEQQAQPRMRQFRPAPPVAPATSRDTSERTGRRPPRQDSLPDPDAHKSTHKEVRIVSPRGSRIPDDE